MAHSMNLLSNSCGNSELDVQQNPGGRKTQLGVGEATHTGLWSHATQTLLHGHPGLPLSQPVLCWSLSEGHHLQALVAKVLCLKRLIKFTCNVNTHPRLAVSRLPISYKQPAPEHAQRAQGPQENVSLQLLKADTQL